MRSNAHFDVQAALFTAVRACVTFVFVSDALSLVDTGRDIDFDVLHLFKVSYAAAFGAFSVIILPVP